MLRTNIMLQGLAGLFFGITAQASPYNSEHFAVSAFTEHGNNAETAGVALSITGSTSDKFLMEGGISFVHLRLSELPYDYHSDRTNALFLYGRTGINWPVAPYIQAGFDIGDTVLNILDDSSSRCCHVNAQAGITFHLLPQLKADIYGSWYSIRYRNGYYFRPGYDYSRENEYSRLNRTAAGIRLSLLF